MRRPRETAPLRLRRATLHRLHLPLVRPFTTSFGTEKAREVLLLELEEAGGEIGYGECVAQRDPLYSSEMVDGAILVLRRYLLPLLGDRDGVTPEGFRRRAQAYRGHPMAKATVEMALQDLGARRLSRPLYEVLGGRYRRVPVGVSVGIQRDPPSLVETVRGYLQDGYGRVKLKVEPGRDSDYVRAVRKAFPQARLWIDANQAYGKGQVGLLARLARSASLELVEQPFPEDRLDWHALLSQRLPRSSRLCLDESVVTLGDLDVALAMRALRSLNIKPGRVGGLGPACELHDRASAHRVPVWCGGMLETGIGRAHNVSLATLPGFLLPSDLSASARYFQEDLIDPPFTLGPESSLEPRRGPGIGVEPVEARLGKLRRGRWELSFP